MSSFKWSSLFGTYIILSCQLFPFSLQSLSKRRSSANALFFQLFAIVSSFVASQNNSGYGSSITQEFEVTRDKTSQHVKGEAINAQMQGQSRWSTVSFCCGSHLFPLLDIQSNQTCELLDLCSVKPVANSLKLAEFFQYRIKSPDSKDRPWPSWVSALKATGKFGNQDVEINI